MSRASIVEDSLPADGLRVSKPGFHQWQTAMPSRGTSSIIVETTIATTECATAIDRDGIIGGHVPQQQQRLAGLPTTVSCDRLVETNVSSAHVVHELASCFVGPSSESSIRRNIWTNSDTYKGAMRLNVPAAPEGLRVLENITTTTTATTATSTTNGGQLGAMVPSTHPSLTIQVNQNDPNGGGQQQDVVNHSSGISIVNCYRAVPVQVVNSSETSNGNVQIVNNNNLINSSEKCDIQCKSIDDPNNASNGGEMQSEIQQLDTHGGEDTANVQRTFISTEAQTDDLQHEPIAGSKAHGSGNGKALDPSSRRGGGSQTETENLISRDQRRRDRRERRQARNARQHLHPQLMQSTSIRANCEIIPDILHSHVPPPYTTLPMPSHCSASTPVGLPSPSVLVPNPSLISPLPVGIADDGRFTFPLPIMRR